MFCIKLKKPRSFEITTLSQPCPQGIELEHNQDTSSEGSDAKAAIQRAGFLGLGVLLLALALLLLLLSSGGRQEQVEDNQEQGEKQKRDGVEQRASGPRCRGEALGGRRCCYNWHCCSYCRVEGDGQ